MLTPQQYTDIFTAAIEGGINYWASISGYVFSDDFASAFIYEEETGKVTSMASDSHVWKDAVAKAAKYMGQSLGLFYEEHDADSADVAMQFAILGEVVYG